MFSRRIISVSLRLTLCCVLSSVPQASNQQTVPSGVRPEVQAILEQGRSAARANKLDQALRLFQDAEDKAHMLVDKVGEAGALFLIGSVYRDLGQTKSALESYEQAQNLYHTLTNVRGEGAAVYQLALLYRGSRNFSKAIDCFQHALSLAKQTDNMTAQGLAHIGLGNTYLMLRDLVQARQQFDTALEDMIIAKDKMGQASAHNGLGSVLSDKGDPQSALTHYHNAAELFHNVGDLESEAKMLSSIGFIYSSLGNQETALQFYQQAFPVLKTPSDRARTLNYKGIAYRRLGNFPSAIDCLGQAQTLFKSVGNIVEELKAEGNLANVYGSLHEWQKALDIYNSALPQFRTLQDPEGEANCLSNIGFVYTNLDQPMEAREFYHEAMKLAQFRTEEDNTTTLADLGLLEKEQNQVPEAKKYLTAAIKHMEDTRKNMTLLPETKTNFLVWQFDAYAAYIDLLLQQHRDIEAFAWVQKAKARTLVDLMSNKRANIWQSATQGEVEQAKALRNKVSDLNRQWLVENAKSAPDKKEINNLERKQQMAESDWQVFTNRIYIKFPHKNDPGVTVSLDQVAHFLPDDAALLEYAALDVERGKHGFDYIVLFVITKDKGKVQVHTYRTQQTGATLEKQITSYYKACTLKDPQYKALGPMLYQQLIAPAAPSLTGKKRLIICPDGPVWALPFAALWTRSEARGASGFLIAQYPISYAFSATALEAAQRSGATPERRKPTHTLLALGNPDFGGPQRFTQIRQESNLSQQKAATRGLFRADGSMEPLPATGTELKGIQREIPSGTFLTGKEAQEAFFKHEAGQYRYLHLATHGIYYPFAPLQSCLVLAAPPAGSPENGFLTARDFLDMDLSADMVVLSACNTALGQRREGEGAIGLTWSLLVAGVPTQVVSQWAVNDNSTANLMQAFYHELRGVPSKPAKRKDEAMQAAMLSLINSPKDRYYHPYYWAAFQIFGDTRSLGNSGSNRLRTMAQVKRAFSDHRAKRQSTRSGT